MKLGSVGVELRSLCERHNLSVLKLWPKVSEILVNDKSHGMKYSLVPLLKKAKNMRKSKL